MVLEQIYRAFNINEGGNIINKKQAGRPETSWKKPETHRRSGGVASRRSLRALAQDEAGQPEPPVYLCHCKGIDMDDDVTRLEAFGIPCLRQYPNDGQFGKLILGISGSGVDIFVPASVWEDACEPGSGRATMKRRKNNDLAGNL